MHYQEFYYWCRDAVSQIRYRPDRMKVYSELRAHMQDRYESYLACGMSEKEAEKKTLAAMGDAKELAPQLAAIHRPHWAYAMLVTRFIACVLILLTIRFGVQYVVDYGWHSFRYDGWDYYSQGSGQRIVHVTPKDVTDSTDGYYFKVKQAALWRVETVDAETSGTYSDQLYVQLDVMNPLPWMTELNALQWMWAVDSTGTYYTSNSEQAPTTKAWITPIGDRTGLWTFRYDIIFQGTAEDMQWVELHYDRDGRDICLRIDLTGGGT